MGVLGRCVLRVLCPRTHAHKRMQRMVLISSIRPATGKL
jgi:hypothetical protein